MAERDEGKVRDDRRDVQVGNAAPGIRIQSQIFATVKPVNSVYNSVFGNLILRCRLVGQLTGREREELKLCMLLSFRKGALVSLA